MPALHYGRTHADRHRKSGLFLTYNWECTLGHPSLFLALAPMPSRHMVGFRQTLQLPQGWVTNRALGTSGIMHHQLADPVRVRQTTWRSLPLLEISQRRHRGADRQDKKQEQAGGLQTPPQLAGVQSSSGQANTSNGKEGWAVVRSSRCARRPGSIYP